MSPPPFAPRWSTGPTRVFSPGTKRSMFFISQWFWWPGMEREVGKYVAACPVFASNEMSHARPASLFRPLCVLHRLCACISLNFVTGPPIQKVTLSSSLWLPWKVPSCLLPSSLPLPMSLTAPLPTQSDAYWTFTSMAVGGSSWLIGRGMGQKERSWVLSQDILNPTLIEDFHREHPDLPRLSGAGPMRGKGGGVLSCLLVW